MTGRSGRMTAMHVCRVAKYSRETGAVDPSCRPTAIAASQEACIVAWTALCKHGAVHMAMAHFAWLDLCCASMAHFKLLHVATCDAVPAWRTSNGYM